MSNAREKIFANIRRANSAARPDAQFIADAAAVLIKDPALFQPKFDGVSNLSRFIAKATSERVTATVSQIDTLEKVPPEVATYLSQNKLSPRIALQPRKTLTELDWGNVETHHDAASDEPVAVSIADLAVAETGSVVFLSASDAPTLLNFLPLHHIVIVRTSLIHRHLDDVFPAIGSGPEDQPRNINIVTGTSGTADIEAKNIRGAHGPRYMHLIIVKEGTATSV